MRDIIGFLFILPAVILIIVYGFIMIFWTFFFGWIPILIGNKSKKYTINIALNLDQLGNTILGGDPDESLSSRAGKGETKVARFAAKIIDQIFFWQEYHSKNAIEKDEGSDAIIK